MGVEELPNNGNKFTGSRMIVPGVGLNIYKVQKNDKFAVKRNQYANSINASPTPTPSFTPTNTPTPTITPTPTPSPIYVSNYAINVIGGTQLRLILNTSLNGTIDWGDSQTSTITPLTTNYDHTYSGSFTGDINIQILGSLTTFTFQKNLTLPNINNTYTVDTTQFLNNNTLSTLGLPTPSGDLHKLETCGNLGNLTIYFYNSNYFSDLPTNVQTLSVGDTLTSLSDDIANTSLLTGTTYLVIGSGNTVYGDVVDIASNITTLNLFGDNLLSGDTSNIPPTLNQLFVRGYNTISGDIANIPSMNAFTIFGNNTITGDIANIPNMNASNFTIDSNSSTIYGDISNWVGYSINFLRLIGNSMLISGTTSDIPTNGTQFIVQFDSLTGDLNNIDKSDFPTSLILSGNSTMTYTTGSWPVTMSVVQLSTSQFLELPDFDVDQFLIDVDDDVTWVGSKTLEIYGDRTSASDSAVSSLNSKGVTVTVYGP
jgi:hypothetical protein